MQDKNSRLARENNSLKAVISQKTQAQEEILRKSIKAEYCRALSYKEMLEAVERSIQALQQSIEECKRVQQSLAKNKRLLVDTTNLLRSANGPNKSDIGDLRSFPTTSGADEPRKMSKIQKHPVKNREKHPESDVDDCLFDRWNANK